VTLFDFSTLQPEAIRAEAKQLFDSDISIEKSTGHFLLEWLNDSPAITSQTSGSTGAPKKILLNKEQVKNSALMTGTFFNLQSGQTALLCLSPDFIAGKMMIVRALVHQMKLLLTEPSSTPLSELHHPVDLAAMVPAQVFQTLCEPNGQQQLERIKNLIIGGGAIPQKLEMDIRQLSNCIYATYGMTETISHIALRKVNGHDHSPYFTPLPDISIGQDERGCLVADAPRIAPEKLITNDLIEITSENSFKLLGRIDNIIVSGGIKIRPEELEQQLEPYIPMTFFIGSRADEKFGERIVLLVEGELTQSSRQEIEKALESLPGVKRPKEVIAINQFQRTATGKLKRQETLRLIP